MTNYLYNIHVDGNSKFYNGVGADNMAVEM